MAEQMIQAQPPHNASQVNGPRAETTTMADHLALIAGHSVKALLRDRGEPTTPAEHRALMQDAALLAQMTWMAVRTRD